MKEKDFEMLVKDPRNTDEQSVIQITLSYNKGTYTTPRGYYLFIIAIKLIDRGGYQMFSCDDIYSGCRLLLEQTTRKSTKRMNEIFEGIRKANHKEIAELYTKSLSANSKAEKQNLQLQIFNYIS